MASYKPMMRDYKPTQAKPQPRGHWLLWFIAGLGAPLITVTIMLPNSNLPPPLEADNPVMEMKAVALQTSKPETSLTPSKEIPLYVAAPEPVPVGERTVLTIRRGDTLDQLFRRNNLSITDLAIILQQKLAKQHLRLIKPGDEIIVFHRNSEVLQLNREIDFSSALIVTRQDSNFLAEKVEYRLVSKHVEAEGMISSSLFEAGADAGISDRTIMNLAGIFAWDIDFVLDIRQGDKFRIIVEELWRDGQRVSEGEILAAEFINQGEVFRAIRYVDPNADASYYTPDGRNMRKAFLRAPVSFSRISSNFNPNRRHPVLNTLRAHKGVDYAASNGTPVMAAGDGKVIFRGTKGGYGNTVIVQHGGNITTLYAHLSKFNRQARNGNRVKQGQTIGYVGQSGLATGPHLHYEYRKNGVHLNPRTVKLPDAAPIDPSFKEDFVRTAKPLLNKLGQRPGMIAETTSITTY
ncbi:MAG: peptidoglycan DD-metalloendopeptidase family protein [Gammaproteobacteria bacterium]|nr:peptidoglycan DD-metalloendopeptidase family protein [Gammaproteobacteria bacterium]MCP4276026.1 peptidoglycan DD-metalloendopeptidase family protein [Gammaproteobacteria bacterium]MCP4833104.1 peptidoglycan DD-metalloendopeptidase family protein [Gammaproteobacteria bacterium]MCP4929622.1 peptidoglycan DD-metalloendopeptidase family protein [Gammaproteobacteria bacterium]